MRTGYVRLCWCYSTEEWPQWQKALDSKLKKTCSACCLGRFYTIILPWVMLTLLPASLQRDLKDKFSKPQFLQKSHSCCFCTLRKASRNRWLINILQGPYHRDPDHDWLGTPYILYGFYMNIATDINCPHPRPPDDQFVEQWWAKHHPFYRVYCLETVR